MTDNMDSLKQMYDMATTVAAKSILLNLILAPLAFWKFVDIFVWVLNHVSINP